MIRSSHFLLESPSSYPKIVSSDLISSATLIVAVIPLHPKN